MFHLLHLNDKPILWMMRHLWRVPFKYKILDNLRAGKGVRQETYEIDACLFVGTYMIRMFRVDWLDIQIKVQNDGLLVLLLDCQKGVSCTHSSVSFNLF